MKPWRRTQETKTRVSPDRSLSGGRWRRMCPHEVYAHLLITVLDLHMANLVLDTSVVDEQRGEDVRLVVERADRRVELWGRRGAGRDWGSAAAEIEVRKADLTENEVSLMKTCLGASVKGAKKTAGR